MLISADRAQIEIDKVRMQVKTSQAAGSTDKSTGPTAKLGMLLFFF